MNTLDFINFITFPITFFTCIYSKYNEEVLVTILCLALLVQFWEAHFIRLQRNQCLPVLLLILLLHPFNGFFSRSTWVRRHQKGKSFWILLQQEMMGWQWHQLHHMQIICTSLQRHNHTSTSPLSFYRPDAFPAAQPISVKALKAQCLPVCVHNIILPLYSILSILKTKCFTIQL